jgi:uroporphyrinogen decarboxylase
MTSRKRMLDTLEMANQSRAPRELWLLPWAAKRYPDELAEIRRAFPPDTVGVPGFLREKPRGQGDAFAVGTYVDDWGCEFVNIQEGVIGEVKHPQIREDDWSDAELVHIPREHLSVNVEKINEYCRAHADQFRTAGCCPRPFEQLQFLRGTTNLYMDLMEPPPMMLRFMENMHAFYCEQLEMWAKTEVDALSMMDDWGSQTGLLISPRVWREIFKPMYKDYIDIAHRAGKKMFMHSDGHTLAIYPDLIELGLDAFNSQIFCIGVENLAPFKGQITFWGEIDRQYLLPNGTLQEIEDAVTLVKDTLWNHGGCIAQCEFGAGGRPENVRKVFEVWDRLTL